MATDIHELFDWSTWIFRDRRRKADSIHLAQCDTVAWRYLSCTCGEPGRQRLMLDAMRNLAADLNTQAAQGDADAERQLRMLLWAFNQEPTNPERI